MNQSSQPHPAQVPLLTEVIEIDAPQVAPPQGVDLLDPPQLIVTRGLPEEPTPAWTPMSTVILPILDSVVSADEISPESGELVLTQEPQPLQQVPTVVAEETAAQQPVDEAEAPQVMDESVSAGAVDVDIDEGALTQRVMADVQRRIDSMLEFRLREAMAPVMARHTEALVRDLRDELASTMRDVVSRAVAQEVAKLRQR